MGKSWVVYILECKDRTLYTGITDDFEKRLKAHESSTGAKYTRGRGPFVLRYLEHFFHRSDASRREYAIKQLSRKEKLLLCEQWNQE
ncbi:MAG: GIY-YIG nuclease family protein [Oscillospiraceae bacterium]|nr:GIY-YIG nuclease family protein [Oscillospiraceae bacterium]